MATNIKNYASWSKVDISFYEQLNGRKYTVALAQHGQNGIDEFICSMKDDDKIYIAFLTKNPTRHSELRNFAAIKANTGHEALQSLSVFYKAVKGNRKHVTVELLEIKIVKLS